ncbi:extracellular solute-binding protein [Glaciimonas soli]|uniref:Extracellular solute-binding protein n=1 Tax=Glaciimonas soli TaxID=2590999 RepID=A0A843YST3_9BURK|nr:extracellular solute-binding protein [Glaciimonas soli]MQR00312.1 extracellular solute-binding protein [Glaciimonas soli]
MSLRTLIASAVFASTAVASFTVAAQEKVLNIYSARHYQTDEALYNNFTKTTGIKINRVDGDDAGTVARLKSEGKSSPADVILLVDAARLWRAENEGLFQPVKSPILDERIPANLRDKDGQWFGFSTRARVIVYNKQNIKPEDVDSYEALAEPKNKGKLCTRSGAHPYNVSLFGALLEHHGEAKTEQLLKGYVANQARKPVGGDTDQIKAVASGECGVTISNSYYVARLMKSTKPEDIALMKKVAIVWPDQKTFGAHVNIAGAGVAKYAPHKAEAIQFLEYLSSDQAQRYFAEGNNEWPAVKSVKTDNAALDSLGTFKAEVIDVSAVGRNQQKVLQMLDKVGYK